MAHINTIEVSKEDMERAAREESYARLLQQWRENKIDDAQWESLRQADPDFRAWLFKMGL